MILNARTLSILLVITVSFAKEPNNTFVATDKWQEIQEGQQVPTGLHYRINLETGKKEAKILEEDEELNENGALKSMQPMTGGKLQKLPHSPNAPTPKKLFESLHLLKEKLKDLDGEFKSDAELITKLFMEFKNATESKEPKEFIRLLDDFSYLVHQIDNALWFIEAGGLEHVIIPMLVNQSDPLIRTNALRVLGTLTQNNPQAKVQVFEKNFANYISKVIIDFQTNQELSSGLFAFGSLLRAFPAAQRSVLEKYGIKALTSVIDKEDVEIKNVVKALIVLNDLYLEAKEITGIELDNSLIENKFCENVENVLITRRQEFNAENVEYVLVALKTFEKLCEAKWTENADLRQALLTLSSDLLRVQDEFSREIAEKVFEISKDFYSIRREEL